MYRMLFFTIALGLGISSAYAEEPIPERATSDTMVSILLLDDKEAFSIALPAGGNVKNENETVELAPGTYKITRAATTKAKAQYHLFTKTFPIGESVERDAYLKEWQAKGYQPEVLVMGKRFSWGSGRVLDNRVQWISMARASSEAEAEAQKKKLESAGAWAWVREAVVEKGGGALTISGNELPSRSFTLPVTLTPSSSITLPEVDHGFWKERSGTFALEGSLAIAINTQGKLQAVQTINVETYLRGILPAEMPSSWPLEALKAQAVAARTEIYASMGLRHVLEGYEYCTSEHCRAYLGQAVGSDATRRAVEETRGEALSQGGRFIPAVFSSNAGGHTENNETVWSAPADAALRGVSEGRGHAYTPETWGLRKWLLEPPPAYSDVDKEGFRWKRAYTHAELSRVINKRHNVGTLKDIVLGDRGVSGRLKWIRLIGAKGSVDIKKDLPIRQALGDLPSSLFILDRRKSAEGSSEYVFIGGGRGHGVGLCQYGARGMAERNVDYTAILRHYFTDAFIERQE